LRRGGFGALKAVWDPRVYEDGKQRRLRGLWGKEKEKEPFVLQESFKGVFHIQKENIRSQGA